MKKILLFSFVAVIVLLVGINIWGTISSYNISGVNADTATSSVIVGNSAPSVSSVSLNSESDFDLTEGTSTSISCTATLTDANGGTDITSATSTIYLSTATPTCTADDNDCYQLSSANCTLGTVSGNDVPVTCATDIWFNADPGAWNCQVTATDGSAATGSGTDTGINMKTLLALNVSSSIDYGTLSASSTMSNLTASTAVTNTGNAAIDVNLSGTDMTGAGTIAVNNQRYSTSSVAWVSGTALSTSATALELPTNSKPTTHPSNVSDNVYWGINIPAGTVPGSYSGVNTFTAIAD